jgi:hypothetical protein
MNEMYEMHGCLGLYENVSCFCLREDDLLVGSQGL